MNEKTKKKYTLCLEIVEGTSWMGMPLYDDLTIDVDFTDDEVATIWQLVSDAEAGEEDAAWIRSRYTIDESWIDVSADEYIC